MSLIREEQAFETRLSTKLNMSLRHSTEDEKVPYYLCDLCVLWFNLTTEHRGHRDNTDHICALFVSLWIIFILNPDLHSHPNA